jgi:hypothetical protein
MRSFLTLLLLAAAMLLTVPAARAGVPDAANSTFPACMALCPMGDIPFEVTVRDLANNPIAGSSVQLNFSSCPNAYLCPPGFAPPYPYTVDPIARTIVATTDAIGHLSLPAHVGGIGPAGSVSLYADGVFFRSYALASPDQNGNGVCVNIVDVDDVIFATKLGTSDPTADFNCDGNVGVADEQIFNHHISHACNGFVDATRRSSWGSLKSHYH